MPKVYEACGLLGAELQSNSIPTCEALDNFIFNPRMPACHGSSTPSPETASFSVFYILLTVKTCPRIAVVLFGTDYSADKFVPRYQQPFDSTVD